MTDLPDYPHDFERQHRDLGVEVRYIASETGRKTKERKILKLSDTIIQKVEPPRGWSTGEDDFGALEGCSAPRGTGHVSIWFEKIALPVAADFVVWMKHLMSAPAHHLDAQEIEQLQKVAFAIDKDADKIDSAQTYDIDDTRVLEMKGRSTGGADNPQELGRWQYVDRVLEVPGKGLYLQRNSYIGESTAFLQHQQEADACFRSIKWTLDYR